MDQTYKMNAKRQSIGLNGRGWTRSGEILCKPTLVKQEPKKTLEEKILEELKNLKFERGKTYKMLSKKYQCSIHYVRSIKLKNKL